jgi:hypothetical protein
LPRRPAQEPGSRRQSSTLSRRYLKEEFNVLVAPYCHPFTTNVAGLLHKSFSAQADTINYDPSRRARALIVMGYKL